MNAFFFFFQKCLNLGCIEILCIGTAAVTFCTSVKFAHLAK